MKEGKKTKQPDLVLLLCWGERKDQHLRVEPVFRVNAQRGFMLHVH